MRFPRPLVPARVVQRYKRFLSDHVLADGSVVTAHCANPGGMIGIKEPGMRTWLAPAANPSRKLAWDWEIVEADGTLIGCHTGRPNALVEEAILSGAIPELAGYATLRREVAYGTRSRVDLVLSGAGRADCYVEVKNCHMRRHGTLAEFPDAVTARGARHMAELAAVVASGGRAVLVYCIQRSDCDRFATAADIDPAYDAALRAAIAAGVEVLPYACRVGIEEIVLERPLPLALP